MNEPMSRSRLSVVVSLRVDVRDFARLLLYWRRQGRVFESRSALARASLETFIANSGVEELDSQRAADILYEESYMPRGIHQAAVAQIVEEAQRRQVEAVTRHLLVRTPEDLASTAEEIDTSGGSDQPRRK